MAFYYDLKITTTQPKAQLLTEIPSDDLLHKIIVDDNKSYMQITLPTASNSDASPLSGDAFASRSVGATPLISRLVGFFNETSTESKSDFGGTRLDLSKATAEEQTGKAFDTVSSNSESNASSVDHNLTQRSEQFAGKRFKIFKSVSVMTFTELNDLCDDNPNIHKLFSPITNFFEIHEKLGEGTSALVKRCVRISDKQTLALKIVNFRGDQELLIQITNEFKNHQKLSHPNVINVHDLFIDMQENKVYISMDFIEGKNLLSFVSERGPFPEKNAMKICKKMLHGLNYLHSQGICHRDIKPENILASSDYSDVKIVDFNVSKFIGSKEKGKYSSLAKANYRMWTATGTDLYKAPEILIDQDYTEAVDMWSVGCTLYFMLSGSHPFQAEYIGETIERIKNVCYNFNQDSWQTVSKEAKELINNLLQKNYKERPSPGEALLSVCFQEENEQMMFIVPFQFTHSEKRGRFDSIVPPLASKTKKIPNQKSKSVDISKKSKISKIRS